MTTLDLDALTVLNRLVGGSSILFDLALTLCDQWPLAICVMVILSLWWTGVDPVPAAGGGRPRPISDRSGLKESRRRCLVLAGSVAAAFVTTRLIASLTNRPRPIGHEHLLVPIDPDTWAHVVSVMTGFGAFPSDHAALFFAMAVGLFAWSRAVGLAGIGAATVFSLARVAVGFHYPSDVLAGGVVGGVAAMAGRAVAPQVRASLDFVVNLFERSPAVMYPLLFVAALDFTQHFRLLIGAVFPVVYNVMGIGLRLAGSA